MIGHILYVRNNVVRVSLLDLTYKSNNVTSLLKYTILTGKHHFVDLRSSKPTDNVPSWAMERMLCVSVHVPV
jgi:hypothetical protein